MKKIDEKEIEAWKLFRLIALMGAAELLEIIAPDDDFTKKYSSYNESNSKDYYLSKILIEVQKTGAVIDRWINYIETSITELSNQKHDSYVELQLESLIDEQSIWQRKLVECLISLICFSESNHNLYYYHYLLLKDLEHYLALKKEQKDFFSEENKYRENATKGLLKKIEVAEKSIDDLSKCWYLYHGKKTAGYEDKYRLLNLRQSMLKAIKIATSGEKTSIGYTYETTFAETSRNMHFNPLRLDFDNAINRFEFGMAQCGLLSTSILKRSQQISGITPKGLSQNIASIDSNRVSNTNPTRGIAEVGDFVLAIGLYLGEVLEIKKSIFGYECYRIAFVDERPLEELTEDWYSAFNIELYRSKKSLINDVRCELEEVEKKQGWSPITFSEKEFGDASRDAIIKVWKLGHRDYLKRSLKDYLTKNANKKF